MENSPLSKLSPELRNTIAEMALHWEGGIVTNGKDNSKFRYASALAHTCKEMRKDYGTLFFNVNTFTHLANGDGFIDEIHELEQIIGHVNSTAMRPVDVSLDVPVDVGGPAYVTEASRSIYVCVEQLASHSDGLFDTKIPLAHLRLNVHAVPGQVFRDFLICNDDARGSLEEAWKTVEKEMGIDTSVNHPPPSSTTILPYTICWTLKDAADMMDEWETEAAEY